MNRRKQREQSGENMALKLGFRHIKTAPIGCMGDTQTDWPLALQ